MTQFMYVTKCKLHQLVYGVCSHDVLDVNSEYIIIILRFADKTIEHLKPAGIGIRLSETRFSKRMN